MGNWISNRVIRLSLSFLGFVLAVDCSGDESRSPRQAATLNGHRFAIELWQSSQSAGADTLYFDDNGCESAWCSGYGFMPAPYTLHAEGRALIWQSRSHSPSDGQVEWRGTVRGDAIEGSMTWQKEGQAPVYYTFSGRAQEVRNKGTGK